MMTFAFDLISDLHVETWPQIDWATMPTSPVCVVAGDISNNRATNAEVLRQLGRAYQAVFYIDGNDEHSSHLSSLGFSYADLVQRINKLSNVVYLQDNVVVIDGVAILGTNGWWGFDLDLTVDPTESAQWYQDRYKLSTDAVKAIAKMATTDATYMVNSVSRLQRHPDVKRIVMVTHTVPHADLIDHDIELYGKYRFNCMGNRYMQAALDADTERKIHTWCFGHYHGSVDRVINGVRYVNNCRGRPNTMFGRHAYYPLRLKIELD